jgi:hypothetical protein
MKVTMAIRRTGQHVVHQLHPSLGHAPRCTRRAPAAAFTAERRPVLVSAACALGPYEAMFQPPTAQIRLELLAYESRQLPPPRLVLGEERFRVLLHDTIEHSVLGTA